MSSTVLPKWINSKISTSNLITYGKVRKPPRSCQEFSKGKPTVIKKWLSQEAIWQVHLPHPKQVDRPHYEDKIPNQMHQFDLLYMPSDMLYGNKYKYILSEINVASRYKVTKPLGTTQAANIAKMIADIYKVGPLTCPKIFQCDQEAIWQVHLPHLKQVDIPHYEDKIPNQMHQFDLLYMPSDMLYGNKYKYILSEIDVASRYKVAKPLRTTQAANIAEMIADIYKVGPLTYPKIFQYDNDSEFKGEVTRLLEKHEVMIRCTTMKYKHTHTAFLEALTRSSQSNYSRY